MTRSYPPERPGAGPVRRVSGVAIVVCGSHAVALRPRLRAALDRQRRQPVAVHEPGAAPRDVSHAAPWVLALDEGDAPDELFLRDVEAWLDELDVELAVLEVPGARRPLWRSDGHAGLDTATTTDGSDIDAVTERLSELAAGRGIEPAVLALEAHRLRPLGPAGDAGRSEVPRSRARPPLSLTVCVLEHWEQDWRPSTVASTEWVALLGSTMAETVLASQFEEKVAVLIETGAGAIALSVSGAAQPHWQRHDAVPGATPALIGVVARRAAVEAAHQHAGDAGLLEVLATATQYGRRGLLLHGFRGDDRLGARRIELPEPRWYDPDSTHSPDGLHPSDGPQPEPRQPWQGWAPEHSQPLELVADPQARLMALASAMAPLDAERFCWRATLGSIDRRPWVGTVPLVRAPSDVFGFTYGPTAGSEGQLLGYVSEVALAEMVSLYERWDGGVADLRQRHGFQPWRPHVPDALHGLFLYRAGSTVRPAPPRLPVFIAGAGDARVLSGHPDLYATAHAAGLTATIGPGVRADAAPGHRGVRRRADAAALVGYGRVRPTEGDIVSPGSGNGDRWWGPAPRPGWVLLYRWDCHGQQRCTTGGLPLDHAGRPLRHARLLGVLGWALIAGSTDVDLVELHHPRRRSWLYSTDAAADVAFGYEVVGPVASMLTIPNQQTVPLVRAYDRRSGRSGLHVCAGEAAATPQRLYGFVELAAPAATPAAGSTDLRWVEPSTLRTAQRPGDRPVVRVVGAGRVDRGATADLVAAAAAGLATEEVVGFLDGDHAELATWPQPDHPVGRATLARRGAVAEEQVRRLLHRASSRWRGC